jgi:hypothetical protein
MCIFRITLNGYFVKEPLDFLKKREVFSEMVQQYNENGCHFYSIAHLASNAAHGS